MISAFLTVAQQVLILFLLAAIGFVIGKLGLLDDHTSRGISNLVMNIVVPSLMIYSFQRPLEQEGLHNFAMVLFLSIIIHTLSILLAHFCLPRNEPGRPLFQFGTIFSNCAFMAYPLLTALIGSMGTFYGSAYVIAFNLLSWTYGIYLLTGDRNKLSWRPILLNPGVLGVVVALALYLLQISLPQTIMTVLSHVSSLNTPLPMIVVGYQISHVDLRRALRSRSCWISMLLRLVVIPLLALALCLLLQADRSVMLTVVITAGAPAAAALSMFAARFELDTELAASVVSTHTLFSLLTMPLVVGLAQTLL